MLRRISDGAYPRTLSQVKLEYPNTNFIGKPTDEQLLPFDHVNILPAIKPVDSNIYIAPNPLPPEYIAPQFYDADTHKIVEGEPDVNNNQVWIEILLTQAELDIALEESQRLKYTAIWDYANQRIAEVENGSDISYNPLKAKRLSNEFQKRLIKESKGQTLTPSEEADRDWYDAFLDWSDAINDAADNAEDAVELLILPSDINRYDEIAIPFWPEFVAP